MPFMIGGFANGLFSGAGDALRLASMYQGYQNQQAQIDAADQAKAAAEDQEQQRKSDENIDKTVKHAQDVGILDKPKDDTQKPSKDELSRPETPDLNTLTKPASGPAVTSDAPITPFDRDLGSSKYGASTAPSGPSPASLYKDYEGRNGQSAPDNQILTDAQRRGVAALPMVRPIITIDPNKSNAAIPTNIPGVTAQPGQNVPPAAMPTYDVTEPMTGPPPHYPAALLGPDMSHVTNTPVGGNLTGQAPQPMRYPPGYKPGGVQPGAVQPGAPGPMTQGGPPGLGSRLLGMLNPIGSAQAAEPSAASGGAAPAASGTPQPAAQAQSPAASASAPPPGYLTTPPAQPSGAPSQPPTTGTGGGVAAPAGQNAVAPTTGTGGAQPPSSPTAPAKPQTGPTETAKPIVPGQTGPTEQSESEQPKAPAFDHRPYQWLQEKWPGAYKMINEVAEQEGANPAQLALHWYLESHFNTTSPDSGKGAVGPFQVIPSTRDMVDPQHKLDPNSLRGSMTLAARYIHMELDPKFGPGTPSNIIAYHSGPGNVDHFAKTPLDQLKLTHPAGVDYLNNAYPGVKLTPANFTMHTSVDTPKLVEAGNTQGPDGFLKTLVSTGPAGMSVSNLWRQAENSLVYAALRRGDWNGVQAARDYVFQMSHQGAMSNLMSADQSLLAGDIQGAAQSLAKAHAFFPDGTYGKFGVDRKGQLVGQQFNEDTNEMMGQPFLVTHDALATQLAQSQDPHKYLAMVQEQQKLNSTMALNAAHQKYYENMPDAKVQAALVRADAETQRTHETNLTKLQIAGAKADNDAKWQANVDKEAGHLYTPGSEHALDLGKNSTPEDYARHSEIFTALRNSPQLNGGHLSTSNAANLAAGIAGGSLKVDKMQQTKEGETYHAIIDSKGNVRGYLSGEQGDRLRGLAGSNLIMPPNAPSTGTGGAVGGGGRSQQTAIGAGAGSQMAASAGYNQNMTGLPIQPMSA